VKPEMMIKRSDFQSMKSGVRLRGPFFLLATKANGSDIARVGYTVTKKQGNSVQRNRMKRRLRALVQGEAAAFRAGLDYVFLASSDLKRRAAWPTQAERPFLHKLPPNLTGIYNGK
jgi:ribonuclease P protein component